MKIDGKTLVSMWERARNAVDGSGEILLRGVVRRNGYDCLYDGYSVCNFSEKAVYVAYGASQIDGRWKMDRVVIVNGKMVFIESVSDCDSFCVDEVLSVAEEIERGIVSPESYTVWCESNRSRQRIGVFNSLADADMVARKECQRHIDNLKREWDISRYAANSVTDDVQYAREHGEVRHYEYYNCDGYANWMSVMAEY